MDESAQLGKYRLVSLLASGGMGEVFLARQEGPAGFTKNVVIKRILRSLAEDEAFVEMFLNEARLAALLEHPNVVQIFELDQVNGIYFIAMEYLHGASLRRIRQALRAKGETLEASMAARICSQALQGLHYAHELRDESGQRLDIVHRDVSPDNILVGFNGVAKVVDFGIAKASVTVSTTRAGSVKGKYSYMAPEQLSGRPVDGRADVYGMGVVLYELLSGVRPFQAGTEPELIRAVLEDMPIPLRTHNPHIPVQLETIIMRALSRQPEARFQSAEVMSHALEVFIDSTGQTLTSAHIAAQLKSLFPEDAISRVPSNSTGSGSGSRSSRNGVRSTPVPGLASRVTPPPRTPAPLAELDQVDVIEIDDMGTPVRRTTRTSSSGLRSGERPGRDRLSAERPAAESKRGGKGVWLGIAAALLAVVGGVALIRPAGLEGVAEAAAPTVDASRAQADGAPASPGNAGVPAVPSTGDAPARTTLAAETGPAGAPASPGEETAPAPAGTPGEVAAAAGSQDDAEGSAAPKRSVNRVSRRERRVREPEPGPAPVAAAPGKVVLRVNPWAEVVHRGRSLGVTPMDPVELPAGTQRLVLRNENLGITRTVEVQVPAGGQVVLKADLLD